MRVAAGFLWSSLLLSGCAWRGTPKVPADDAYDACMRACGPGGACVREGEGWKCLPPVIPVTSK